MGAPAEWPGHPPDDGAPAGPPDATAAPAGTRRARRRVGTGAWCAALLLVAVSVVAGCRVADTDGVTPIPQLLAFWPWLIAPLVVALLLAAYARSRTGLVWGLLLLGLVAWFMEPYGRVAHAHGTPVADVRVLTSNVEFGGATGALVDAIRHERPDLVFVQECDTGCFATLDAAFGTGTSATAPGETETETETETTTTTATATETGTGRGTGTSTATAPSAALDSPAAAATSAASAAPAAPGTTGTYPYRQAAHAPGAHGSVILSRYPLRAAAAVHGTMAMPGALARVHGHDVRLQLAHPMPPRPDDLAAWHAELGALRDFAARAGDGSVILAGDFNASQDHAAFRRILDTGLRDGARLAGAARAPSWPSRTTPTFGAQIDHVLVSDDFSASAARFLTLPHTDHRALLTDLTLHG